LAIAFALAARGVSHLSPSSAPASRCPLEPDFVARAFCHGLLDSRSCAATCVHTLRSPRPELLDALGGEIEIEGTTIVMGVLLKLGYGSFAPAARLHSCSVEERADERIPRGSSRER